MTGFHKWLNIITFLLVLIMFITSIIRPITKYTPTPDGEQSQASIPNAPSDTKMTSSYTKGMYSWDENAYKSSEKTSMMTTLEALSISELYQYIPDNKLYSVDTESLLRQLNNSNIDVYYLTGQPEWGIDRSATQMKLEIDKVVAFNKAIGDISFKGIIFDVEPYLTDEWLEDKQKTYAIYVDTMKIAYDYAQEKGVQITICIPNWLDRVDMDLLKTLISEACDKVAVMNYNRRDEIPLMEGEVSIAKEYNKPISCIFEFQAVGKHSLTDNETYANLGLSQAKENFEALRSHYGYEQISFAYHYLKPVYEMLSGVEKED